MTWRRLLVGLLGILLVAGVVWWAGCLPPRPRAPFAQVSGYAWNVEPRATAPIHGGRYPLDSLERGSRGHPGLPIWRFHRIRPEDKLHPDLVSLPTTNLRDSVEVVIGLRDPLRVPRLALDLVRVGIDSVLADSGQKQIDKIWNAFYQTRGALYQTQENDLRPLVMRFGREMVLTQAVVATVERGKLADVAGKPYVTSVIPARLRSVPPQDDEATRCKIRWIAEQLNVGPYRSAGLVNGRIRLLDTGVNDAHDYFRDVPRTDPATADKSALVLHNCVGDPDCGGADSGDIEDPEHGTDAAAILVAGDFVPEESRGITNAKLHACRIWLKIGGVDYVDVPAYERALQGAYAPPPEVAVLQVTEPESPEDQLANIANGAFEAGIVVVAAIGNHRAMDLQQPGTGARSPGSARGVLGIGARACSDGSTPPSQGSGGVPDRNKPDLQFYSGTNSPGPNGSRIDLPGTSGAAPYAAAAALGMRELLEAIAGVVDPGQVYAALLACAEATRDGKGRFPQANGAGLVRLPSDGEGWFSSEELDNGADRTISFPVGAGTRHIRAALWWEDPLPLHLTSTLLIDRHRDFDLEIDDPSGGSRASSSGVDGVFERAEVDLSGASASPAGDWRIHIRARNVGLSPAIVYWAVFTSP